MEMKIIFFLITLVIYVAFIFLAKKEKLPKLLTPNSEMGMGSKVGYSLFGILVCYIILRVISQQ
jgi:hypothetical protein